VIAVVDDFTTPGPVEVWPQLGRGGHLRNAKGEAIVSHPDGGKRVCVYDGASDWCLDKPYDGDPIHGHRGQLVHDICDRTDRGESLDDDFIAHGVTLGISPALQQHIATRWTVFLKTHGLRVAYVELVVVNDAWRKASNIDRVVNCADGVARVLDIKSAANVAKASYVVQLATYAHESCVPYTPETGERGTWGDAIDRERAIIAHFPIGAAIRGDDVDWTYIEVELAVGFEMGQAVADLAASVAYKDAFSQPITALVRPTPTFAEAKAIANAMSGGERTRIRGAMVGSVPGDEAAFIAAVMLVHDFDDVVTEPAPRAPAIERPTSTLPTAPDEGDWVFSDAVIALEADYKGLDDVGRSWIGGIITDAQLAGLNFNPKGNPTTRRVHLLAALVKLRHVFAGDESFDEDDTTRGCLAPIIGAELADAKGFSLGQLVGCCSAAEASRFRDMAACLAEGSASMVFTDAGECRVEVAA